MNDIKENIAEVKERIRNAAASAGRSAEDVRLITVTKTVDAERIKEAIACGAYEIGENRVQEILGKYDALKDKAEFHLIGHLQTNKVKYIIDKVKLIHSVESLDLVKEIDKRAKKADKIQDILIEVNVSGEESKFGIKPEAAKEFVYSAAEFENVKVCGLMTVAPYDLAEDDLRRIFSSLRKISLDIESENIHTVSMKELSMGMTGDYEAAIKEGATMVRIGTGIFGKRNYL